MKILRPLDGFNFEDLDICPNFFFCSEDEELEEHIAKTKALLLQLLPANALPIFNWSECKPAPSILTLSFLSKSLSSLSIETFVQEMIKRWLIPNDQTTILSSHFMQFYFKHNLKQSFFISEVKIIIKSSREYKLIRTNLPLLKKEIIHGIQSGNSAKSILETKHIPIDQKSFLIREHLIRWIRRFPDDFDEELLHRFAFFQAIVSDKFKEQRSFLHLTKLIGWIYLIPNRLERELRTLPEKRHLLIRLMQQKLSFTFGQKPVLGMIIGLNFFDQFEFFEEKHILLSVQKFFPYIRLVSGSFYRFQKPPNPIVMIYVELEKEDGSTFSFKEIKTLRNHLSDELNKRIETLVPSLFIVRNEEEIMRQILFLSQEIKELDDYPQITISFDQHSQEDLTFTVVLLRIKDESSQPIEILLRDINPNIRFIIDRVQNVRYLNKIHPIEANVFRLQITKLPSFLRMDFSVNLYLARQEILHFLTKQIGEVRDYNGGMILKQGELLADFKRLFQDLSGSNQERLENFFYSLNPIEAQAIMPLNDLSFFFECFLNLSEKTFPKNIDYQFDMKQSDGKQFILIRSKESDYQTFVMNHLKDLKLYNRSIISVALFFEGFYYLGYYFTNIKKDQEKKLEQAIQLSLNQWVFNQQKPKILRLATTFDVSLDPRVGGDVESSIFNKLLFEGLMRRNRDGVPECAIAESYNLSEDRLRYMFKLRKTFWSNGSPLVAYDFEYAWKKILSPDFSTSFSFLFGPILNAREAKDGKVSLDQVGIKAIDDDTLVVDLAYQAPYFIELIAHTIYSPINHRFEKMHPNWSTQKNNEFICNGPYKLKECHLVYNYELEKNPYYWKHDQIYFDHIVFNNKLKNKEILDMYNQGTIDYSGVPLSSIDCFKKDIRKEDFGSVDLGVLFWICLNVEQFPFGNLNMRRALAAALNRKDICKSYMHSNAPAYTILPHHITNHLNSKHLIKESSDDARVYFQQALDELKIKRGDIPIITLMHSRHDKIRGEILKKVKNQWETILGIKTQLESFEWHRFFDQTTKGHYHVGLIKWRSYFNDPIYTLNAFKYRNEGVNFSNWENKQFQDILKQSDNEKDLKLRNNYLIEAEKILMNEMPVIPLSYHKCCFAKSPKLKVYPSFFSKEGPYDFSQISIDDTKLK